MNVLHPQEWLRAIRNPVVLTGLAVDLAPVYAVIVWGWGAAPLVMLYWIENVIAGLMTLPRLIISGANFGGGGVFTGLVMSAFFVLHYGLFCAVHGTFLMAFVTISEDGGQGLPDAPMMDMIGMFGASLRLGPNMNLMIGLIAGWQVFVLVYQFIAKGDWRRTSPMAEMFAPYGRIIILHFGIFAGAGALFLLGDPMPGVLLLILLRAIWGVHINSDQRSDDFPDMDARAYDLGKLLKTGDAKPDPPERKP